MKIFAITILWFAGVGLGIAQTQTIDSQSSGAVYSQAIPVTPITPPSSIAVELEVPIEPVLPSVETIQAQQQARINWGVNIGRISGRELRNIQQSQARIERQRYYAYLDGWFTPEEQQSLYMDLNALSERIERSLFNVELPYVSSANLYVAPTPLYVWVMPWWNIRPHYVGHHIHYAPAIAPFLIKPKPNTHPQPSSHITAVPGHANSIQQHGQHVSPVVNSAHSPHSGHTSNISGILPKPNAVPKPNVVPKPNSTIHQHIKKPSVNEESASPQAFPRK